MAPLVGLFGLILLAIILWDSFEAIILPRRVTRRVRLTRMFYRFTWLLWSGVVDRFRSPKRRDKYLGFYGPLSMLLLLVVWAAGLIVGFAMLHWALGSQLRVPYGRAGFLTDLYMSGTTFFTLGLGDVTPQSPGAHVITVIEAGTGFGFLALVIGYLPVLYQAFSDRETNISLLDARAGSPATASELLRRYAQAHGMADLDALFHEWERWSAELLESHLSYPVLCYFRSQHDNQSWLASLNAILDACAVVITGLEGVPVWQAQLTFAMARHAIVDLAQILNTAPRAPAPDRLAPADCERLRQALLATGLAVRDEHTFRERLVEMRRMYEPYVNALSNYLRIRPSTWMRTSHTIDNWRTSAWERSTGLPRSIFPDPVDDEHSS